MLGEISSIFECFWYLELYIFMIICIFTNEGANFLEEDRPRESPVFCESKRMSELARVGRNSLPKRFSVGQHGVLAKAV